MAEIPRQVSVLVQEPITTILPYEKPIVIKEEKMTFPLQIITGRGKERLVCKQCSSCHACR